LSNVACCMFAGRVSPSRVFPLIATCSLIMSKSACAGHPWRNQLKQLPHLGSSLNLNIPSSSMQHLTNTFHRRKHSSLNTVSCPTGASWQKSPLKATWKAPQGLSSLKFCHRSCRVLSKLTNRFSDAIDVSSRSVTRCTCLKTSCCSSVSAFFQCRRHALWTVSPFISVAATPDVAATKIVILLNGCCSKTHCRA
jgi:hypothetical protein